MRVPDCDLCPLCETTDYVYVEASGPERSPVAVVGEAPGYHEELSGEPFVGAAGQLLNSALRSAGLDRQQLLVTNACRCRPPENRTPKQGELKACAGYTDAELKHARYVLLLGSSALKQQLGGQASIKALRGKPFEKDGRVYLPTFHPAFIMRDERNRPAFEADIRAFSSLVTTGDIPKVGNLNLRMVQAGDMSFREMLDDVASAGSVSLDIETSGIYAWAPGAHVVSIGLGTRTTQWVWPIRHHTMRVMLSAAKVKRRMELLAEVLSCVQVIGQFSKFDAVWLKLHYGVDITFAYDVGLAHYNVNENSLHDLEFLAQNYYSASVYDVKPEVKQGAEGTMEEHANYLAQDLYFTRRLRFDINKQMIDAGTKRIYERITLPASRMYRDIELTGVTIDVTRMDEVEQHLRKQLAQAEWRFKKWGKDINLASPQQLKELLFTKLKLKPLEYTKKGAASTNESVLKRLEHPCVADILKHRRAKKLLGTFIEGWKPYLVDGELHPSFKIHGTVTGRPSCEHPNFQQTDRDPIIRSLVIAPDGWELVEFDLSQAELRITAELSRDPTMLQIFESGGDIHRFTAASVLGVPIDEVSDEQRYIAKSLNFGLIYGMYEKRLIAYCRDEYGVTLTRQQAHQFRNRFFRLYARLPEWHERSRMFARRNGYVRCLSGRIRRLPVAMQPYDSPERGEAERQAINSPVQGFVSDMNLMVALQAHEEFSPDYFKLCATVHDSGMAKVRNDKVKEVGTRLMEIMKRPALLDEWNINLRVPMVGEVKIGPWSKGIKLEKWREHVA